MKKFFLLVPVAALAMTACTSESNEFVGDSQQQTREITFSPLTQPTTRADRFNPFAGTGFPDNYTMDVSANLNDGQTYFSGINFAKSSSTWKGATAQYWPLTASTLNFLAVTNWETTPASPVSTVFTNCAQSAVVTLGNNAPTDLTAPSSQTGAQHDLMYAVGRGIVTNPSSNTLSYSGNAAGNAQPVDMEFKHALSWVNFTVQTAASYPGFKLNSITLKGAYYGGTYTLNNTNYNYVYDGSTNDSRTATAITGVWSSPTNQANVIVPGWTSGTDVTTTPATVGYGLVVVPTTGFAPAAPSFTGFTISYEFNGQTLSFDYSQNITLEQAKKYTYSITFTLTEIEINPTVLDWTSETPVGVNIPQ